MPSGLTSMSSGSMGASKMLAASLEKASLERPWNDRVQSTWRAPSSRITGSSLRPLVRSDSSGEVEIGGAAAVREVVGLSDAGDCAGAFVVYCALCAWYTFVDVNALRVLASVGYLR